MVFAYKYINFSALKKITVEFFIKGIGFTEIISAKINGITYKPKICICAPPKRTALHVRCSSIFTGGISIVEGMKQIFNQLITRYHLLLSTTSSTNPESKNYSGTIES